MMRWAILTAAAVAMASACDAQPAPSGQSGEPQNRGGASPARPSATKPVARSRFTSIEPNSCKLIEEKLEEGGWWRRLCTGAAGYQLETSESDLRQDIVVIAADGRRSELGLSTVVANGAFNSLGKTVEWRGVAEARPQSLIVRLNVASSPEGDRPDISHLVVVRLDRPTCVVAVVPPGANQNVQARRIADSGRRACLSS